LGFGLASASAFSGLEDSEISIEVSRENSVSLGSSTWFDGSAAVNASGSPSTLVSSKGCSEISTEVCGVVLDFFDFDFFFGFGESEMSDRDISDVSIDD